MASAYRPRHKTKYKHNFTNNWKPNSKTKNYTKLHPIPKQLQNIIPTTPITPHTKTILTRCQKPNKKKLKILYPYRYYFITSHTSSINQKSHTITTHTPREDPYPPFTPRKSRNITNTLPNPITITKTGHKIINKTNTQHQPTNKRKPDKTHKKYACIHLTPIHLGNIKLHIPVRITNQKINKSHTLNPHLYQNPKPHPIRNTKFHPNTKWPRPTGHKTHNKYHLTRKGKSKEIKNPTTTSYTHTHFLPKQLENITPTLYYDTHPNHRIPQPYPQYTSHSPHAKNNLHPRTTFNPKYKSHLKHRLYLKTKYIQNTNTNERIIPNLTTSYNSTHIQSTNLTLKIQRPRPTGLATQIITHTSS